MISSTVQHLSFADNVVVVAESYVYARVERRVEIVLYKKKSHTNYSIILPKP